MVSQIISGADEKIIRIFDPPFNFIMNMKQISGADYIFSNELKNEEVAK